MTNRGWHHWNQRKLLEELREMNKFFPNNKLIEFIDDRIGFIGSFTIEGEKKYFKIIYPLRYPRSSPRVYLLDNKDDLQKKVEFNSEHQDTDDYSICLFPSDDGSQSWRPTYTAADAIKKLKNFYETNENPDLAIKEHTSVEFTFPGIPFEGTIYIPYPLWNQIINKKLNQGTVEVKFNQNIFWITLLKSKISSEDFSKKKPWDSMINKLENKLNIEYLLIEKDYKRFKENSYKFSNFKEFLKSTYKFEIQSNINYIIIFFGDNSFAMYFDDEGIWEVNSCRVMYFPGKIIKIPDSFFPRVSDFFQAAFDEIQTKRIAVIGLGSLGSTIAYQLVKSGIISLDLYDYDILQPENISRHIGRLPQLGQYKTEVMKEILNEINPETIINSYNHNPFSGKNFEQLKTYIRRYNLVIITTANLDSEILTNDLITSFRIPTIFCWCSGNADCGEIFIHLPRDGACYECFLIQKELGLIYNPSKTEGNAHWRIPGREPYNMPGIPGISIDIDFVGLFTARLALQVLMLDSKNFARYYPKLKANYYYWNNREKKEDTIMSFGPSSQLIQKYNDCPICSESGRRPHILINKERRELKNLWKKALGRKIE